MRVLCIIQARMGSTRLPAKATADIRGRPMLAHIIDRLKTCATVDDVVVATTSLPEDDRIVDLARDRGVSWSRGPVDDVLTRFVETIRGRDAELIVHAFGDNPLVCPEVVDTLVEHCGSGDYDFAMMAGLPAGFAGDVYSRRTFTTLDQAARTPAYREHINAYILDNLHAFRVARLPAVAALALPELRLTVDTPDDLALIRNLYRRLYRAGCIVSNHEVIELYRNEPHLFSGNMHIKQLYVSNTARVLRGPEMFALPAKSR